MKFSLYLKIACTLLLVFFLTAVEGLAQDRATYEVKQGDTLYGISRQLNVSIAELQQWNNLEGNQIELGQELIYYFQNEQTQELTEGESEPLVNRSTGSENVSYIVKSGDSLYKIAGEHNMTVQELKDLNNLTDNNLRIGQRLAVKKQPEVPPSVVEFSEKSTPQGVFSVYEIKSGENLEDITSRFKMTENEFRMLNPELDMSRLQAGRQVTILLPPSRNYENPYLQKADLQDLGEVQVFSYSDSEFGETTTNGELYDPEALTAAHSNISLGSIIFVENVQTGTGVYIRVNDRITGSGLKLSRKAYSTLRLNEASQPAVTIYTEVDG
ncbi:MAG: LysM peptidoglycan-binding domain-containing protein [Gracilimonas sp.]|uniref:LysM peptidoglycan-binding domain-containing protein n=1 Tax=Gracilimonas sp. TaxID=1974203 RepID=UPI00374FE8B8|nr:LysM peptidoglycan-binding domain-containing protein [Gracilimonas sp.]